MTEALSTELLEYYTTITPALKSSYGELLSGLAEWQWFFTMTFKTRVGEWAAQRRWSRLWTEVQRVTGRLEWWRATEYQHWRGVPHYHALVTGIPAQLTGEHSRVLVKEMAHDIAGITRVLEYDPALGAAHYMAKYTVKSLGDIQFTRGLTNNRRRSIVKI
ncbi:hypothetical protein ES705_47850 [subsurface metagenome]|jgi:hypothetical protein